MIKKINLGCGPVGKADWVNIDWGVLAILHRFSLIEALLMRFKLFPKEYNVKWPKNLKLHDCKKRLPFASDSVDYIYTSHFLEHFKKYEGKRLIDDCYRTLKKGGLIRVALPDLGLLAKKYVEKDAGYFRKSYNLKDSEGQAGGLSDGLLLADIFNDNFYPGFYRDQPRGLARIMACFIRPHYWMYDYDLLEALLRRAGFKDVRKMEFRQGRVPDLDYLDVFPETSLYVEAEK